MENPIKMDDLGGAIIFGNTHIAKLSSLGVATGNRVTAFLELMD